MKDFQSKEIMFFFMSMTAEINILSLDIYFRMMRKVSVFCTFGDEYIDESKVPYWMPLPEPPKGE